MQSKVTIAVDSFKGSLSSHEAAQAIAEGVRSYAPECRVEIIPVADGGEGSAEVLTEALGGVWQDVAVCDPLGRPLTARYGFCGSLAVIDVASAAGLTLLRESERNPLNTTTLGVGLMMADALRRGAREILLGVGGSATNDCAMGALEGLGFRFVDADGAVLRGCGVNLERVAEIDPCGALQELAGAHITLVTDVDNLLLGAKGAATIFAPQKGASKEDVARLEEGARHFAECVRIVSGKDMTTLRGGGAAGGLAAGLWALCGASIECGVEYILQRVDFAHRAEGSALVVTGEGRVDAQTLMGKLPVGVLSAARRAGLRVVAVGGSVEWSGALSEVGFDSIVAATPEGMPLEVALRPEVARDNLRRVGALLAERYLSGTEESV